MLYVIIVTFTLSTVMTAHILSPDEKDRERTLVIDEKYQSTLAAARR